jgi:hypothetical protein
MSERSIEGRVGAIELGKGAGMKLFETSDKATKLCFRRRVGRFISERGPPDEFGVDILPAMAAFFSTRALSFALIGTTNLSVARLMYASLSRTSSSP